MAQARDALGRFTIAAVMEDRFSKPIKQIGRLLRGLVGIARKVGRGMRRAFTGTLRTMRKLKNMVFNLKTLFIGAFGVAVIRQFVKFEAGLTQVATLADFTAVRLKKMGDAVLKVGQETGDSFDSLNSALFDLISSGVDAGKSTDVLRIAAKLAAAGGTETSVAVDGLTSILNAYGLEADSATEITDSLFQAMKGGKLTIAELTPSLGKIVTSAAKMNVSFDDVNAAIAAMTLSGVKVSEATVQLNAFFVTLLKSSTKGIPLIDEIREALNGPGGLLAAFTILKRANDEMGDSIIEIFPNIRAMKGIFALTANEGKNFNRVMATMAEKAGATNKAWLKVRATLGNQFKRVLRTVETLFIRIGEAAKPFIEEQLEKFQGFVASMAEAQNRLRTFVQTITGVIRKLGELVATLFSEGDVLTFVFRLGGKLVEALIRLQIVFIPTVVKIASAVGREIGIALIRAIFGTSQLEITRALAARNAIGSKTIGAKLLEKGLGLIFSEEERKSLISDAKTLAELESIVSQAEALQKRIADIASGKAFDTTRPELGLAGVTRRTAERSLNLLLDGGTIQQVKDTIRQLEDAIISEMGASKVGSKTSEALRKQIAKGIKEASKATERLLKEAVDSTKLVLTKASGTVLDELFEFITQHSARMAKAKFKDLATEIGTNAINQLAAALRAARKFLDQQLSTAPSGGGGPTGTTTTDKKTDAGFFTGFSAGIKQMSEDLGNFNTLGQNVAFELGSALLEAFVSLFDDSKKSIKQWGGVFLRIVAQMIAQAVLFRSIASFLFPGGGGGGSGDLVLPTRRFGGPIRRGFGGPIFGPSGRDQINARLTHGEYVHRPESVKYYGENLMAAINRMAIPRELLRGIPRVASGVHIGTNFAGGGGVSSSTSDLSVLPILPMTEQFMQMALAGGGKQVMLRFLREHKSETEGFSPQGSERL